MTTMQDTRILGYDPLVPPNLLRHEIVSSQTSRKVIGEARQSAAKIIAGEDDRILVIVGPCSIHDPEQAMGEFSRLALAVAPLT
jgi:3-deoxy-7-phosphoheptulonate synthase